MTLYDEVNLLVEKLLAAWGRVVIECNGQLCQVSDGEIPFRQFEAPTLLEALRLAEQATESATGQCPPIP